MKATMVKMLVFPGRDSSVQYKQKDVAKEERRTRYVRVTRRRRRCGLYDALAGPLKARRRRMRAGGMQQQQHLGS
jgi:hypothetical protein